MPAIVANAITAFNEESTVTATRTDLVASKAAALLLAEVVLSGN
jgi:hypothetical protein